MFIKVLNTYNNYIVHYINSVDIKEITISDENGNVGKNFEIRVSANGIWYCIALHLPLTEAVKLCEKIILDINNEIYSINEIISDGIEDLDASLLAINNSLKSIDFEGAFQTLCSDTYRTACALGEIEKSLDNINSSIKSI